MGADLGLACPADKPLSLNSRRRTLGLFSQALGFVGETFFERWHLFETASVLLHGAPPCFEGAGAQPAFSSPINATIRAVTRTVCARQRANTNPFFRASCETFRKKLTYRKRLKLLKRRQRLRPTKV
jgi:hypothetical protein